MNFYDSHVAIAVIFPLLLVSFLLFSVSFKKGKLTEETFFQVTKLILVSFIVFAVGYYVWLVLNVSVYGPQDDAIGIGNIFGLLLLFASCSELFLVAKIRKTTVQKTKYVNIIIAGVTFLFVVSMLYFFYFFFLFASLEESYVDGQVVGGEVPLFNP